MLGTTRLEVDVPLTGDDQDGDGSSRFGQRNRMINGRDGSRMSPRQYRLGKRAEAVEQTRERIIDATRELLAREGYPHASVDAVARVADVARATVYYQFGSKKGLIQAVVQDIQQRAGQEAVVDSVEVVDPVDALRQAFVMGSRFWAAERPLVHKLTGLAAVDADVRRIVAAAERDRLPLLARLVDRLAGAQRLVPSYSSQEALHVLWMLSSFEAFDQLFTGRGLPVEDVARLLGDLAVATLTDWRGGAAAEPQ
jgi:AcrR family transcriptional regulator